MTKHVRIENADTSPYQVVVEIWEKGYTGEADKKVDEVLLGHPTAITGPNVYLTSTRYIVVREADPKV